MKVPVTSDDRLAARFNWRSWVAPVLAVALGAAVLATEPGRGVVYRAIDTVHDGFLVVFLQAGSFVAGCF